MCTVVIPLARTSARGIHNNVTTALQFHTTTIQLQYNYHTATTTSAAPPLVSARGRLREASAAPSVSSSAAEARERRSVTSPTWGCGCILQVTSPTWWVGGVWGCKATPRHLRSHAGVRRGVGVCGGSVAVGVECLQLYYSTILLLYYSAIV